MNLLRRAENAGQHTLTHPQTQAALSHTPQPIQHLIRSHLNDPHSATLSLKRAQSIIQYRIQTIHKLPNHITTQPTDPTNQQHQTRTDNPTQTATTNTTPGQYTIDLTQASAKSQKPINTHRSKHHKKHPPHPHCNKPNTHSPPPPPIITDKTPTTQQHNIKTPTPGLTVLTWNPGPGGLQTNISALSDVIDLHKPKVIHLQDTKVTKDTSSEMTKKIEARFPEYKAYINCKARTEQAATHHSVMTLIHKGLTTGIKIYTSPFPTTAGRFLAMKITADNAERPLFTANVYFPTSGDTSDTKFDLMTILETHIAAAKAEGARIVIAGDLNATGNGQQRSGYSEGIAIARADIILQRFITRNELHDASSNTEHADTHTWYSTDLNKSSKLDHILTDAHDTAITTLIDEAPFAISDHMYTLATINTDIGTTSQIQTKQAPTARLNLEHRDTLASIWKTQLDLALRQPNLPTNPTDRLEQAQLLALRHAEEIYGFCIHFHRKPFASSTVNRIAKQIALIRALRRHLWSILAQPLTDSEPRRKATNKWQELKPNTIPLDLDLKIPHIDPTTVTAQQILSHLDDLHSSRTKLLNHKNKIIRDMQNEQTKQYAERMRRQLFSPGTRAIQKATGKAQAATTMTSLRSHHPNELTIRIDQNPEHLLQIRQHCAPLPHPHRITADNTYCWITTDIHTDLITIIEHATTQAWHIERVRSTNNTILPDHIKPETHHGNILSSLEYDLVTNARDIATRCTGCHNHKQNKKTTDNLIAISSTTHNQTPTDNHRTVHNYCSNCTKIMPVEIDKTHYDQLPFPESILTDNKVTNPTTESLRTPVDLQLLRKTIQSFKSRKSPGDDGMLPELWKDAPDSLLQILLDNINLALRTGHIPDAWRGGTIRFLLKKQPETEFKNWRPVVLLRLAYKIYTRIVNDRLRDIAERHGLLSQAQEGFRSQHSVQRQIIRLTTMIAHAKRKKLTVFLTLADFQNAFNSAPHSCILKVLELLGVPDLDIIADLLNRTTFRSINNVGTTAHIGLTRGIKQGGVESPLIFCLFAEALLRLLDDANRSFRSKGNISETAGYADDLAVLSASTSPKTAESNHAELHKRLELYSNWADIAFNIPKCRITAHNFTTRTSPNTSTMTLNAHPLPFIDHSTAAPYLGAWISLNGDFKTERANIIAKLKRTAILLKNTVYSRSQVDRLLNMCIIPLFTFTAGIVNWTQTELNQVNSIWAGVRKYAWKLPLQTSTAPFTTAETQGGLEYEPAESFLLKTQHNTIEQCLQHDDELRTLLIDSTQAALYQMGVNTTNEATAALRLQKHNDICQWNPVIRHLRWLASIGEGIDTDIFDTPTQQTTLTHLLHTHRTRAKFQTQPLPDPKTLRIIHKTPNPKWTLALNSLTKHLQSRTSNFISTDRTRIRSWTHLSPPTKAAVSKTNYEALQPLLTDQLSTIQHFSSPHKTQHPITSYTQTNTNATARQLRFHQTSPKLPATHTPTQATRTFSRPRISVPTLLPRTQQTQQPQRLLNLAPQQNNTNTQTSILDTHTYTRRLHDQTMRALSQPRTRDTAKPPKTRTNRITCDLSNSTPSTTQLTSNWLATKHHGFTALIQRTPIPKPIRIQGNTKIITTFKHDTRVTLDTAILHTHLYRQSKQSLTEHDITTLLQQTSTAPHRFLHWNFTSTLQRLTQSDTLLGHSPIHTDPGFRTTTLKSSTTPTIISINNTPHSHRHWKAHTNKELILLHQGKPDHNTNTFLRKQGYTHTTIPRFTKVEQLSNSIHTGAYTTHNSTSSWTIFHKQHRTHAVQQAIEHTTSQEFLTHHDTGTWNHYHQHSQYGTYLNTPGILVATDGSHDPQHPDKQMGGGIAYRTGDGRNRSIGVRGSPSSFGAEAGTLDFLLKITPHDQHLTILIDAQSLIQQVQRLTSGETHVSLTKHIHQTVLESITNQLLLRTAPTHLVKIKSHAGAILNEQADTLANDGRTATLTGSHPHDPTQIHHWHSTLNGDCRYSSPTHRQNTWIKKLQARHHTKLLAQDTTTFHFMSRPDSARQHIKRAVTQTTDDFNDTDGKRFLQAYTGTFPTKHKLWLMGRAENGFCPHCTGQLEHMAHWQCTCPHFNKSRQAAHNAIVQTFHGDLRKHAGKDWTISTETPMRKSNFSTSTLRRNWQPDGIATKRTTKQAILLELTRCDDSRHNTNLDAIERKEIKYDVLLDDLATHNNQWKFTLHTTAIGYLSSTDTTRLAHLYTQLEIPTRMWENITQNLVNATVRAFAKMARERQAAMIQLGPDKSNTTTHKNAKQPKKNQQTRRKTRKTKKPSPPATQRKKKRRKQ